MCNRARDMYPMFHGWTRSSSQQTPNILVIWGDDIGYWNVSVDGHRRQW